MVEIVCDVGCLLGEGPVWDPDAAVLWFVDIKRPKVHRLDPATGIVDTWPAPSQTGWALPAVTGRLLAGLQTGIAEFDPSTGIFYPRAKVEPLIPSNRLNDATVGPDGVVWFGSMDDYEKDPTGRIYRWNGRSVEDSGIQPVCITNGPAVSPDGWLLYYVDTIGGVIHVATLGSDGRISATREFASIDPAHGHPDGVTVDCEGNVWVGLWGGGCVRLYGPDGSIVREVRIPAANVTKVALGDDDLKTAYVTTARIGMDEAALARQPHAGGVFAFRVDVPGQCPAQALLV